MWHVRCRHVTGFHFQVSVCGVTRDNFPEGAQTDWIALLSGRSPIRTVCKKKTQTGHAKNLQDCKHLVFTIKLKKLSLLAARERGLVVCRCASTMHCAHVGVCALVQRASDLAPRDHSKNLHGWWVVPANPPCSSP